MTSIFQKENKKKLSVYQLVFVEVTPRRALRQTACCALFERSQEQLLLGDDQVQIPGNEESTTTLKTYTK